MQQLHNSEKYKGEGNKGGESDGTPSVVAMAKAYYISATKALEAAKLTITTAGALRRNLLSNEARQPWEKIIKA